MQSALLFCLPFICTGAVGETELEKFTRLYKNTVELFVSEHKEWFRNSLKTFGHYLKKHPRSPYQEYFDLFFVPLNDNEHSGEAADAVFIPYPEPFLDENSPNHSGCKLKEGNRQYSSDSTVAGLAFSEANPLLSLDTDESQFNDSHRRYSEQYLLASSCNYEHAYFKSVHQCSSPVFRKGGAMDQFLLVSLCVSDASNNHYELCIPMGLARQFTVNDIIDPSDEFTPLPDYTEETIWRFLSQLERHYDPKNPGANHYVERLLGRGISAQVMEPASFLRSAAIKRIIKEVPDTQSADEFILTAQVNMRLLTMAEIRYLPLIYFQVPARTKGKVALYGVQKKCDSSQFLDHLFEDYQQPAPPMEKLLDDIITLLRECDISNARQLKTLLPALSGFSLAVDPNYTNYFYDGERVRVVDLTPFFMAFEGQTPDINQQFLDMELEGIATHFNSLSLKPLHRYLFFLGMLFRTSRAKTVAYKHCIVNKMNCDPEQQKDELWRKLFDHALLKVASMPPVHNEILRRIERKRFTREGLAPSPGEEGNSSQDDSRITRDNGKVRRTRAYAAYHSDVLDSQGFDHEQNGVRIDRKSPIARYLHLGALTISSKVDQWKKDRWLKRNRDKISFYGQEQKIHTLQTTPYFMNDVEARSYANFILGLEYSRAHTSPNSLWISISNWLERNHHINPTYTGGLSVPELRRMSQIAMSRYHDDESLKVWGNNNIPQLLVALASLGFYFQIQVIQPNSHFQPRSTLYWFDSEQKQIATKVINNVPDIKRLMATSKVLSLLLHQTSDAPSDSPESRWSEVSPLSNKTARLIQRYPVHDIASWRFNSMDRLDAPTLPQNGDHFDQGSIYFLKLILLISTYQQSITPSAPSLLFSQLQSHLPRSDMKKEMTLGTRIGHLFMALLLWLDSLAVESSETLPDSVLLIHPGLGFSVDNPVFSVWTIQFTESDPRVITRGLTHNVKLESINTTKPGQLIFFTNTVVAPTGDLLSMHYSKPEWWIVNGSGIMNTTSKLDKLPAPGPLPGKNRTERQITETLNTHEAHATAEELTTSALAYMKEKYEKKENLSEVIQ